MLYVPIQHARRKLKSLREINFLSVNLYAERGKRTESKTHKNRKYINRHCDITGHPIFREEILIIFLHANILFSLSKIYLGSIGKCKLGIITLLYVAKCVDMLSIKQKC